MRRTIDILQASRRPRLEDQPLDQQPPRPIAGNGPAGSEHYFQVLLTEFILTREANHLRDQYSVTLYSFILLILTAAFAFLGDAIRSDGDEALLLVISGVFSLIGLLYLSLQYVQQEIQNYEHEVLKPKIQRYLNAVHTEGDPEFEEVITLQAWYTARLKRTSVFGKIVKASTLYTPLSLSMGTFIWFTIDQILDDGTLLEMTTLEFIVFIPALVAVVAHSIAVFRHFMIYSKRRQWKDNSANIASSR